MTIRILIVMLLLAIVIVSIADKDLSTVDRDRLREFLESQYVPEARLLRAATMVYPDNTTIWIASDNLLVAKALAVLGSPYAPIIETELQNKYNGGRNGQHEVLLGINIPNQFYEPVIVTLDTIYSSKFNATLTIKYEYHNGTLFSNWQDYADLIVYRALDSLLEGSRPHAKELFNKLMSMWDGYGFKDAAFDGKYATYKLALAIYLYRALKATGLNTHQYKDIISKCYEIISKLQRSDGGIVTDYMVKNNSIIPIGDANVETTSIVVLAIYSNYPELIGKTVLEKQVSDDWHLIIVFVALLVTIFLITYIYVLKPGEIKERIVVFTIYNFSNNAIQIL